MKDFTLEMYGELLRFFIKSGYTICSVDDYLSGSNYARNTVIMRHDIDRRIHKAVGFAHIEHDLGIRATYYFRYPYTFQPPVIQQIADMGHEIGYHYEVMSKADGDPVLAGKLFHKELDDFRKYFPVKTICMHGAPLSKYDNRDLWNYYSFEEFDLSGEAYLSMNGVYYYSDTGRTWSNAHKIRDRLQNQMNTSSEDVYSTLDLIRIIKINKPSVAYILIHPERWAGSSGEWLYLWGMDTAVNIIKKPLAYLVLT